MALDIGLRRSLHPQYDWHGETHTANLAFAVGFLRRLIHRNSRQEKSEMKILAGQNKTNAGLGFHLIFLLGFSISTNTNNALARGCNTTIGAETMPCFIDTISTVEVTFQGNHLQNREDEYRRLLRLRIRNDLSMLRLEDVEAWDVFLQYNFEVEGTELRRRASFRCDIWTVGDTEFPIAYRLKCEIGGFGTYPSQINSVMSTEMLGFGPRRDLATQISEALRSAVASLAGSFLEIRGGTPQPAPQSRTTNPPPTPAAPQRATNPPRRL